MDTKCSLCQQVISPDDTVGSVGYGMARVDCGRPRSLSPNSMFFSTSIVGITRLPSAPLCSELPAGGTRLGPFRQPHVRMPVLSCGSHPEHSRPSHRLRDASGGIAAKSEGSPGRA